MFAGFAELRDAMLHGFAQSEAREVVLTTDVGQLKTGLHQLNTKVDRIETRVEHIETDVGALKNDMSQVKTWIARKDSKRR